MTRWERLDTPAELEAAQRDLIRLAFEERRPHTDPERESLQLAIHEYAVREAKA
jgi:hypothetical protein